MQIRKNILPRTLSDVAATTFLFVMIFVTLWFELFIVIPKIHGFGSFLHIFYATLGVFVTFNIVGNLIALMICDTSIKNQIIQPPSEKAGQKGWHLCTYCESIAPPRSWHCVICGTCILKRDHHCIFSGTCVGFHNHRYFMLLLFYLSLSTILCGFYNSYFIWIMSADFQQWISYAKIIFPLAFLMVDYSIQQYYFLIYLIDLIGAFLVVTLLYYHCSLIKDGTVVHEKNHKIGSIYNYGISKNFKIVLGSKYYLTWISPHISSPLPHDGIYWESIETTKTR